MGPGDESARLARRRREGELESSPAEPAPQLHAVWGKLQLTGGYAGVLSVKPAASCELDSEFAVWICEHSHRLRTDALVCAMSELTRRQGPVPAKPAFTVDEVSELPGARSAPGPAASRPYDSVTLSPAGLVDRPADSRLSFERDGSSVTVQLAPADRRSLFAALYGAAPGEEQAQFVRSFLTERLEQVRRDFEPACGEIGPGPDVRALERVIAMLEER
jgi:hypothetical protein